MIITLLISCVTLLFFEESVFSGGFIGIILFISRILKYYGFFSYYYILFFILLYLCDLIFLYCYLWIHDNKSDIQDFCNNYFFMEKFKAFYLFIYKNYKFILALLLLFIFEFDLTNNFKITTFLFSVVIYSLIDIIPNLPFFFIIYLKLLYWYTYWVILLYIIQYYSTFIFYFLYSSKLSFLYLLNFIWFFIDYWFYYLYLFLPFILNGIFFIFVSGLFILLLLEKYNLYKLRFYSVLFFNVVFLYFFMLYCSYSFKMYASYYLFCDFFFINNLFNLNIVLGLDNISLIFILLTSFLFIIANLISLYNIKYNFKFYIINLILLEFLIILSFLSINIFYFYLFFEFSLIPMFFIIGVWGSRQRKIYAVYQFIFYTLIGSIFLISAILILYSTFLTLDIRIICNQYIPYDKQIILWVLLFIGFSTKIPLVPFHVWLPEAHVEAPTAGSVLLAGILLKIGTYGILRFILPIYNYANYFYLPLVYTLSIISIIYISFIILSQIDLKKIIAYSSILHMNFIVLGLFTFNLEGLVGSIFLMISHGLISSGLFICIGILYDRYKTRNIIYFGGLVDYMPIFSVLFFLFILANIGFPFTSNFIGEVLVGFGLIENNFFLTVLLLISTFFGSLYSIWLYNRLVFGVNNYLWEVSDISEREFFVLFSLLFFIFLFGIKPNILISFIECGCLYILEYTYY